MNALQFFRVQLLEVNYSELLKCKYSDSFAKFKTSIHYHFAKKQILSRNKSKSSFIINYLCLISNLKYNKPEQSLVLLLVFNDWSDPFIIKKYFSKFFSVTLCFLLLPTSSVATFRYKVFSCIEFFFYFSRFHSILLT